ncbi:MAG TPA: cytochrome c oxidase assembly protein [Solirubrobacterales bacterium]|nr:cytochrome c oxidase assembly protein [Solirubrobacterales bacterium]
MDLTALYLLVLPAALYVRAVRVLGRRGYRVPRWQQVSWFAGLTLMGVALLSPLDSLGETDLLSAHMAQHLLIADLSAPLLVIGLRSPVYAFILPRALFAELARSHRLRAIFRTLKQPWVSAPVWIAVLYGWHLAPAYEAALRSPVLHALQHQTFIAASILLWVSVLEPARRRVPGELWKIPHIVGSRFAGMFLGMAFVVVQRPIYEGFYGTRALEHGLTPTEDQQIAGGLMLAVDFLVMIGALLFFFFRAADDAERKQEAEDSGRAEPPMPVPGREVRLG